MAEEVEAKLLKEYSSEDEDDKDAKAKKAMKKKQLEEKAKKKAKDHDEDDYDDVGPIMNILELPVQYDCGTALKEMFEKNKALIHVDFSYNDFKTEDCKLMAAGLLRNNTILGLHMLGNDFDMDA